MAKTLQLTFNTASGKKVSLSVDEPREDLTPQSLEAAMQKIIATDVFEIEGAALASIASARVIERSVTEIVNG